MPAFWVLGEQNGDGTLARISTEAATLARTLAGRSPAGPPPGSWSAGDPGPAANELAAYLPRVVAVADAAACGSRLGDDRRRAGRHGPRRGSRRRRHRGRRPGWARRRPACSRRLTGRGVLVNATAAAWDGRLDGRDERLRRQADDHLRVHRTRRDRDPPPEHDHG